MPDHSNITPPPPEPLPTDRKRTIRARLLAAANTPPASAPRRWLVPGLAAAAVLTIICAGAFAASRDGDSGAPGSDGQVPVGGTTTSTTATTPSADASTPVMPNPSTVPPTVTTVPPAPTPAAPGAPVGSCANDIEQLGEPSLQGASVTARRTTGPATTWLYETKSAWIVCDDLTASDGGAPTLFAPHDKAEAYQPDVSTLKVSDNLITNSDGSWRYAQFVAAGRDFDGVQAISYAFPDGHVEDAVVGQNGLWSMNYLATRGLFLQHGTNVTKLDPIEVTVHYTSGDVKTFSLQWGLDTCAQINHGC